MFMSVLALGWIVTYMIACARQVICNLAAMYARAHVATVAFCPQVHHIYIGTVYIKLQVQQRQNNISRWSCKPAKTLNFHHPMHVLQKMCACMCVCVRMCVCVHVCVHVINDIIICLILQYMHAVHVLSSFHP